MGGIPGGRAKAVEILGQRLHDICDNLKQACVQQHILLQYQLLLSLAQVEPYFGVHLTPWLCTCMHNFIMIVVEPMPMHG